MHEERALRTRGSHPCSMDEAGIGFHRCRTGLCKLPVLHRHDGPNHTVNPTVAVEGAMKIAN
jgi:hypothetical protein